MTDDDDARLAAIAADGREAIAAGATLDDVLHGMKHRERLGAIEAMIALRAMSPMSLVCAKQIVSTWCEGTSYAHVTLAELDMLGDAPRVRGVDFFIRCERDAAILEREPHLLHVESPESPTSTWLFRSATPLASAPLGHPHGTSSRSLAAVRQNVRDAVAAWPTEIRVVRDEPRELAIHFVRALAEPIVRNARSKKRL